MRAGAAGQGSPGDILLDAVEAALGAVAADVGEVEGECPRLRGAVGLGDGDVLHGDRVSLGGPPAAPARNPGPSLAICERTPLVSVSDRPACPHGWAAGGSRAGVRFPVSAAVAPRAKEHRSLSTQPEAGAHSNLGRPGSRQPGKLSWAKTSGRQERAGTLGRDTLAHIPPSPSPRPPGQSHPPPGCLGRRQAYRHRPRGAHRWAALAPTDHDTGCVHMVHLTLKADGTTAA